MGGEQGKTDVPLARRPVRRMAATSAFVRSRQTFHRQQAIIDRLSFCRQDTEAPEKLSDRPLVSWWL
jgi:hypothetical protein